MIDVEKLSNTVPEGNGYLAEDGLLHCRKCGGYLQTKITVPMLGERIVNCICDCMAAERNADEERKAQEERERNRRICFGGSKMMNCTFENSRKTELLTMAENYCKHFQEFRQTGKGLLLHGTVGTGKSHMAACIANRLIDEDYKVLMTNFATVVNQLQSSFDGRQEYIDSLNRYSLLILDDLGAERNTEYMREQVFNVIDSRYRSGLPMIITSNLTIAELAGTEDLTCMRIYDRILERCHPIEVEGQSNRRQKLKTELQQTEMLLRGK